MEARQAIVQGAVDIAIEATDELRSLGHQVGDEAKVIVVFVLFCLVWFCFGFVHHLHTFDGGRSGASNSPYLSDTFFCFQAKIVNNLLTILCSDANVQPVIMMNSK